MWYAYLSDQSRMMALSTDSAFRIIEENEKGVLPAQLEDYAITHEQKADFSSAAIIEEEDISRFDKMEERSGKRNKGRGRSRNKGRQSRQNTRGNYNNQGRKNNPGRNSRDGNNKDNSK